MAGENLTSFDPLLKDVYVGPINENVNNKVLLWNILSGKESGFQVRKPVDKRGRKIVVPTHVSRNWGGGAVAEDGLLPVAQTEGFADEIVNLKYLYHAMRLTAQVIEMANGDNENAFASAMTEATQGVSDAFAKDLNRECYGDGNGKLATVGTGGAASGASTIPVQPTMYLEPGMVFDVVDASGTVIAGNNTVKTVTYSLQGTSNMEYVTSITITGTLSAAITAGQFLVRNNGNSGANNWSAEVLGLQAAINNSGTYLNIDPTATSVWVSTLLDNGGNTQNVSEKLLQALIANPARRVGDSPDTIITTDGIQSNFANALAQQKRFQNTTLRGGFTELEYNGRKIIADVDCPYGNIFAINTNKLGFFHTRPPHWADTGGTILHWDQTNGARDAAVGYYRYYVQLATWVRAAHSRATNVAE